MLGKKDGCSRANLHRKCIPLYKETELFISAASEWACDCLSRRYGLASRQSRVNNDWHTISVM